MPQAIYLRKSRAEEFDSTEETLKKHRETLFEYAKKNNLDIVKVYEEVISGETLAARPKMLELLNDVEKGSYDGVLCMDIDRLGRGGMAEQGIILETFKQSNTKIYTPRRVYDLNNEMDEEYTEFEAFFARRELKIIKRRMSQGKQASIKNGCYMSNAPFGYIKATQGKSSTLEINENESPYVKLIYQWYIEGLGCQAIAYKLNEMGVKPRRSDKFSRSSVMHILKNPTFCGKIIWNQKSHIRKGSKGNNKHEIIYNPPEKWIITEGIHPAIIDENIYEEVQTIIRDRTHPPTNMGIIKNPLAGLCFCEKCGMSMVRRPDNIKKIISLICPTKGCQISTQLKHVETALLNTLSDISKGMAAKKNARREKSVETYKKALSDIRKELNTCHTQKAKLHDLLEQEVYTLDIFLERTGILRTKIEALQKSQKEIEGKISESDSADYSKMKKNIDSVLNIYETSSVDAKNKMLKKIINKIDYSKTKEMERKECELKITLKFKSLHLV